MKTHNHDGVLSTVIDNVEERIIDTNTLIEKKEKKTVILIVIENELIEFGF